jgi:hypothetical protein
MLSFIERNKFSIIIALIVHMGLFVWFNVQIVFKGNSSEGERVVAVIDFSAEPEPEPDPLTPEQIAESQTNQTVANQNAMNVAANANQDKTTYTNSYSKAEIDKQVWEELKGNQSSELLKNSNSKTKEEKTTPDLKDINKNLVKEDAEKNDKAAYGNDVVAVASYSVPGRSPLQKFVPSYKCKVQGVVRVNIKVDQKGKIQTPEIDETKTNTQNECLRLEALEYARKWIFDQNFTGPLRVSGWIEFKYIAQ